MASVVSQTVFNQNVLALTSLFLGEPLRQFPKGEYERINQKVLSSYRGDAFLEQDLREAIDVAVAFVRSQTTDEAKWKMIFAYCSIAEEVTPTGEPLKKRGGLFGLFSQNQMSVPLVRVATFKADLAKYNNILMSNPHNLEHFRKYRVTPRY